MDPIQYHDFELQVKRQGRVYTAQARSQAGESTTTFRLPFTRERLENLVLRMGRRGAGSRRVYTSEVEAARELGGKLFDAVFSGEILANLRSGLAETTRSDTQGLRLKLRLQDVPELTDIPWEYLFDRQFNRFLAQSSYTPIIRYIDLPESVRPLLARLPLRLLVVISSPDDPDYPPLDVTEERRLLDDALAPLIQNGSLEVEWLEHGTLPLLQRRLRDKDNPVHILHYIGHGGFDRRSDEGVLVLEDDTGRAITASGAALGVLLHDHRALRLIVLNSCEGARNSRDDPFSGVASTLVLQGIPAVVAMQFEITDGAAITFAGDFYSSLASGYAVDSAIAEARKGIAIRSNDIEWGTPVLYMRTPDGVIFDLEESQQAPPSSAGVETVEAESNSALEAFSASSSDSGTVEDSHQETQAETPQSVDDVHGLPVEPGTGEVKGAARAGAEPAHVQSAEVALESSSGETSGIPRVADPESRTTFGREQSVRSESVKGYLLPIWILALFFLAATASFVVTFPAYYQAIFHYDDYLDWDRYKQDAALAGVLAFFASCILWLRVFPSWRWVLPPWFLALLIAVASPGLGVLVGLGGYSLGLPDWESLIGGIVFFLVIAFYFLVKPAKEHQH